MPSATRPLKRCRHGPNPWRMAITSTAMKPMLCRFRAMPGSGLPSPTQSCMTPPRRGSAPLALVLAALVPAAALARRCPSCRGRRRRLFRRVGHLGRRRHGGDHEVAPGDHRPRPLDPLQVAPAHTGVEIEARQIGAELLRDAVRVAIDLDRVADDVQHTTTLEAGTEALVLEMHRHRYAN